VTKQKCFLFGVMFLMLIFFGVIFKIFNYTRCNILNVMNIQV
jgi:hypothetical protein